MQATSLSFLIAAPVLAAAMAVPVLPFRDGSDAPPPSTVVPRYDKDRALLLPENYLEWVFVGSSLGLSYDASAGSHEMFNETLMEPTAYRHFVKTGEFREGTMFVLILHGAERAVLPGRRGHFAGDVHGVEMAVKDKGRTPEGWAYYGFGGMGGALDKAAQPEPGGRGSCVACHQAHAARDNVFLQFYPLLAKTAGITVPVKRAEGAKPAGANAPR
jgi:cytochrome P460